jgi:predicted nucleotidyltransferase
MDKKEVIKIVKTYAEIVKTQFPVKHVILYGSYAKGIQQEHSDIDVAIVVDKVKGNWLSSKIKLFKLRRDIDPRIEPVLLEKDNDPSGFLEEIMKTGVIIYSS